MSSLDDFFAKKDKSKKKKPKFASIDGILAKEEEPIKKTTTATEKKKKEPKEKPQGDGSGETRVGDEEEWKDFEQETETDYSGLRIQTLQINKEEENEEKFEEEEVDEDGEIIERKDPAAGPWSGVQTPKPVKPAPEPVKPVVVEEPAPKTTGKYVPPGARMSAMNPQPLVQRRAKKSAPNLTSEEDFPTLGIMGDKEREAAQLYMSTGSQFERVRSGGRQSEDPTMRSPQLTLGNKFEALQRE